jgi:hypothetical protein
MRLTLIFLEQWKFFFHLPTAMQSNISKVMLFYNFLSLAKVYAYRINTMPLSATTKKENISSAAHKAHSSHPHPRLCPREKRYYRKHI